MVTESGQAAVHTTANAESFKSKFGDYIDSYLILYKEILDCAKEIEEKSHELAATFFALSKFLEQISELHRIVKSPHQHQLYGWLSKIVTGQGNFQAQVGNLFKNYFHQHLKY